MPSNVCGSLTDTNTTQPFTEVTRAPARLATLHFYFLELAPMDLLLTALPSAKMTAG